MISFFHFRFLFWNFVITTLLIKACQCDALKQPCLTLCSYSALKSHFRRQSSISQMLPRPLSPRFGLLITGLGYHRLPTEIIATRNLNVTGDIFVALFFFFRLSWYNAFFFKRNVATKTMSILAPKIGGPNSATFSKLWND